MGHQQDVGAYYDVADLLAIPSISEGSPNVLLEALAAGVPVVATSVGGIPEMVRDRESALLVQPHSPREMGEAILLLLTNRQLKETIVNNGRELVAGRYSPDVRANALVELYRNVHQRSAVI